MLTSFDVYLVAIAGPMSKLFLVVAILTFIGSVAGAVFYLANYGDKRAEHFSKLGLKIVKWTLPVTIVSGFLAVMIPSTPAAAAMYILPKIANSQVVQQLPRAMEWELYNWEENLEESADSKACR